MSQLLFSNLKPKNFIYLMKFKFEIDFFGLIKNLGEINKRFMLPLQSI